MLARPERFFEDRFGLTSTAMERLLGSTLAGRVDHADLYLEYRMSEELVLEDGGVKKAARHISQGAGVRAQADERTGYAHTDDISLPNLEEAARQARAIADRSSSSAVVSVGPAGAPGTFCSLRMAVSLIRFTALTSRNTTKAMIRKLMMAVMKAP